jgi:D-glycero-D-manno-heptose 1,7-bisphosphate phosphatase
MCCAVRRVWPGKSARQQVTIKPTRAPPVFLDRDGTLIVELGYLSDPNQVRMEEGVVEGLTVLRARGHPLVVLSNQSGIGRGMFTAEDAQRVNARLAALLRDRDVEIMAWYLCPHTPETSCDCRKPLPGMAVAAARDWQLELPGSYVIGDKRADLELADAIGGTGILVTTGHGREFAGWARGHARPVFDSLLAAADYIVKSAGQAVPTP